jgi:hypothetical protein
LKGNFEHGMEEEKLAYPVITRCSVCEEALEITRLECRRCRTKYEGHFKLDKFSYLTPKQKFFIEIFLKCRGNIKEVEKELNISYPTVRSKLDDVIRSLGYEVTAVDSPQMNRKEILDKLSKGEITSDEAIRMLKG